MKQTGDNAGDNVMNVMNFIQRARGGVLFYNKSDSDEMICEPDYNSEFLLEVLKIFI